MRSNQSIGLTALLTILTLTLLGPAPRAAAQQETVLHSFGGNNQNGTLPQSSLILDAAGNLYGTTIWTNEYGYGTVFELMPQPGGGWTEKVLHTFSDNGGGTYPLCNLIFDASGNLYGTTAAGGIYNFGTVFELSPMPDGSWTEKTLHSFNRNGHDGYDPWAGVTFDAAGNLYGMTPAGGTYDYGVVFELSPQASGGWSEQVLHSFNNNGKDGYTSYAGLVVDAAGNLYGTTYYGGAYTYGTVFELKRQAAGNWGEKILHNFTNSGTDGDGPFGGLTFDGAGNLYGSTINGTHGTVFELTPTASGNWTQKILTTLLASHTALAFDRAGNLYFTLAYGGAYSYGAVIELMPQANGDWNAKTLHSFSNIAKDGLYPNGVIVDASGNVFGTTNLGGAFFDGFDGGTVFEITP